MRGHGRTLTVGGSELGSLTAEGCRNCTGLRCGFTDPCWCRLLGRMRLASGGLPEPKIHGRVVPVHGAHGTLGKFEQGARRFADRSGDAILRGVACRND